MKDAQPEDIYVDRGKKLWRVIGVCGEPTVIVEEIESTTPEPLRMTGGVSCLMWEGFKRIWRDGEP